MTRIHQLPDEVINRIAAGEVVERPASVVKELVENALDAGADSITIELVEGGRKSITVTDDGCGMDSEDAAMAMNRHATSKINTTDDLFSIDTMGFRGEALASIASVSRFSLLTSTGSGDGTKVVTDGGEKIDVLPANCPVGTSISVSDLFFNVPVRAKFLKTPGTEYSHCLELVQAISLCHPDVTLKLVHNDKEQLLTSSVEVDGTQWRGEKQLRQRAVKIFGTEAAENLLYIQKESQYGSIEALLSPPGIEKASTKFMFTFVNGRWVKDKTVRYGVLRGYHSHLLKGRYPQVIVHLITDPTLVDVNVHPSKTELRFQYPSELQKMMAIAIREELRKGGWINTEANSSSTASFPSPSIPNLSPRSSQPLFHNGGASKPAVPLSGVKVTTTSFNPPSKPITPVFDEFGADQTEQRDENAGLGEIPWDELEYIGSFGRCYLMFEHEERLLVIDQHAFHERILFERLCRDETLLGSKQALLVPHAVELSPSEIASLEGLREEFKARAFEYKIVGDTTVEILAVPTILVNCDMDELFTMLANQTESAKAVGSNEGLAQDILATIACHAAVRAGEHLGDNERNQLIAEAKTVEFYHNCPHGRRVFRWWNKTQIERWFDRT